MDRRSVGLTLGILAAMQVSAKAEAPASSEAEVMAVVRITGWSWAKH